MSLRNPFICHILMGMPYQFIIFFLLFRHVHLAKHVPCSSNLFQLHTWLHYSNLQVSSIYFILSKNIPHSQYVISVASLSSSVRAHCSFTYKSCRTAGHYGKTPEYKLLNMYALIYCITPFSVMYLVSLQNLLVKLPGLGDIDVCAWRWQWYIYTALALWQLGAREGIFWECSSGIFSPIFPWWFLDSNPLALETFFY